MLSVVLTFQKAVLLTARLAGFIVGLSLTTRLVESCLTVRGPRPHHDTSLALLELSTLAVSLIFGAVSDAALLGLLREPDTAGWRVMWASVRAYTWVLVRLSICIALIAFAAMIPLLLFIRLAPSIPLISLAIAFIYLVLLKYALAYPLAVNEQLSAREALQKSWQMTRGHFAYVLLCYLAMALIHFTVNQLFASPWLDAHVAWSLPFFIKHLVGGFFDSLWIILGWQMYLEIKDADGSPSTIPGDDYGWPRNT